MGEKRDRGVLASEAGVNSLELARASQRNEKGQPWTYTDIAKKADLDDRTVRRFFHREQPVDLTTAQQICEALDVELDDVLNSPDSGTTDRNGQISNPFNYGTPVSPKGFYGRSAAIADVRNRIGAMTAQSINIVGLRRMGKSSLLQYIAGQTEEFCQPDQRPLIVLLDLQNQQSYSPERMIEGLRRNLREMTGSEPWAKEDNQDPYVVEDSLYNLKDRNGYRLVVMLDEFEAIGRRLEVFQDWGEDWRAKASAGLFALVVASKHPIREIYGQLNLTSPFDNIFSTTILGALEEEAWQQLVRDGLGNSAGFGKKTLRWIDGLAGGVPFYVQMAAALLWQHGNYEEAERAFRFQATARFEELWQNLNEVEQIAVRSAAGVTGLGAPAWAMTDRLQRHGLLRSDGQLFSTAFADYLREQG